jgi:hypothetical protein
MPNPFDHPLLLLVFCFSLLWFCAWLGAYVIAKRWPEGKVDRDDFSTVLPASLTLLGLIIGFTFSMALSRFDLRKNCEAEEANAIGTEYARAELLAPSDTAQLHDLLRQYVAERIQFFNTYSLGTQTPINRRTAELQRKLWTVVRDAGIAQPNVLFSLAISGMNDVLNAQGYTQAAWSNRIPTAAWILMVLIAMVCNTMVGYTTRNPTKHHVLLLILPLMVGVAFYLIADIGSPIGGLIHVQPQNLQSVADMMQ